LIDFLTNRKSSSAKTKEDDFGGKVVTSVEAAQILREKRPLAEDKLNEKVHKATLKAEKADTRAKKALEAAEAAKLKAEKAADAAKLRAYEGPKNIKKKLNVNKVSLLTCYKFNELNLMMKILKNG
jgi:regulator of protease activity HflC (stomatin/prohibitin superfamily)